MSPDTNHTSKIVFGGKVMAEMDKLAFLETIMFLADKNSLCDEAVTFKVWDLVFHLPSYLGDIIHLESELVESGSKSITVKVKGRVWRKELRKEFPFCEGTFLFISTKDGKPTPH